MPYVAVKGDYTLIVEQDDYAESPRETEDCFGTMVCFHSGYRLGDEHKYKDNDDFLSDLFYESVGNEDKAHRMYQKLEQKYFGEYPAPRDAAYKMDAELIKQIEKNHVIMPLYLYDHSGISMSVGSFVGRDQHAEWDSGIVGWVYASKEDIIKEFGGKNLTPSKREKAEKLMEGEVNYYDSFLRGDCYGFKLYESGVETDSCWGFIGSLSEIKADLEANLPIECEGITESLAYECETPPPSIETLLSFYRGKAAQRQPPIRNGGEVATAAR